MMQSSSVSIELAVPRQRDHIGFRLLERLPDVLGFQHRQFLRVLRDQNTPLLQQPSTFNRRCLAPFSVVKCFASRVDSRVDICFCATSDVTPFCAVRGADDGNLVYGDSSVTEHS
jgi:hypothetical protein